MATDTDSPGEYHDLSPAGDILGHGHRRQDTRGDSDAARRLHRVLVDKGINAMDAALLIEAVEDEAVTRLRKAVLMFGHEYDVDGRSEWHSFNCTYRKTWAMGGDDDASCIAVREALIR